MKLTDARKLRDSVARRAKCSAVVPLGHGPDGYFVQAYRGGETLEFADPAAFEAWVKAEWKKIEDWAVEHGCIPRRPRSAIERLVDEACGVKPEDYDA